MNSAGAIIIAEDEPTTGTSGMDELAQREFR